MDYQSRTNQKILGDFVAREVIMTASLLVEDLLDKGLLSYEHIENYYSDSEEEPQEVYEW